MEEETVLKEKDIECNKEEVLTEEEKDWLIWWQKNNKNFIRST